MKKTGSDWVCADRKIQIQDLNYPVAHKNKGKWKLGNTSVGESTKRELNSCLSHKYFNASQHSHPWAGSASDSQRKVTDPLDVAAVTTRRSSPEGTTFLPVVSVSKEVALKFQKSSNHTPFTHTKRSCPLEMSLWQRSGLTCKHAQEDPLCNRCLLHLLQNWALPGAGWFSPRCHPQLRSAKCHQVRSPETQAQRLSDTTKTGDFLTHHGRGGISKPEVKLHVLKAGISGVHRRSLISLFQRAIIRDYTQQLTSSIKFFGLS